MNRMSQVCATIALAVALSTAAFANPPAGKGPPEGAGPQSQPQGQGEGKGHADDYRRDNNDYRNDGGKDDNHGQVVSECNHRANERNLKGHDRKEWTEWCEERGTRHSYDYNRYSTDRKCYQKADNKGLNGDKRRKFINDCLDHPKKY
jgi:hypothetical protein